MVFKFCCASYFPGEPVKILIPGFYLSEILITCAWSDAQKSAFEHSTPEESDACGPGGTLRNFSLELQIFPYLLIQEFHLGIYFKEIFQKSY